MNNLRGDEFIYSENNRENLSVKIDEKMESYKKSAIRGTNLMLNNVDISTENKNKTKELMFLLYRSTSVLDDLIDDCSYHRSNIVNMKKNNDVVVYLQSFKCDDIDNFILSLKNDPALIAEAVKYLRDSIFLSDKKQQQNVTVDIVLEIAEQEMDQMVEFVIVYLSSHLNASDVEQIKKNTDILKKIGLMKNLVDDFQDASEDFPLHDNFFKIKLRKEILKKLVSLNLDIWINDFDRVLFLTSLLWKK